MIEALWFLMGGLVMGALTRAVHRDAAAMREAAAAYNAEGDRKLAELAEASDRFEQEITKASEEAIKTIDAEREKFLSTVLGAWIAAVEGQRAEDKA